MREHNDLYQQQVNEEAARIVARLLPVKGVNQQLPAVVIYANLRDLLVAILQQVELRGYGFDADHPKEFEILLNVLAENIRERLEDHEWPNQR